MRMRYCLSLRMILIDRRLCRHWKLKASRGVALRSEAAVLGGTTLAQRRLATCRRLKRAETDEGGPSLLGRDLRIRSSSGPSDLVSFTRLCS